MRDIKTALAILLIAILSSCNKLDSGMVVDKWYEPEDSGIECLPDADGIVTCESWYEPERFMVTVQNYYEGELRRENWSVGADCWSSVNYGDSLILNTHK